MARLGASFSRLRGKVPEGRMGANAVSVGQRLRAPSQVLTCAQRHANGMLGSTSDGLPPHPIATRMSRGLRPTSQSAHRQCRSAPERAWPCG
ncbi:hypothetical protein XAP412_570007 [Xanthomonas phaseoli pv. phaseoli]|uniref:Uncharacterized protein n=1 Tax=Xanthomonas campestris pv. phaseoli TaxID=317013 RepID=A0AB38E3B1_XANCH|nr:hypothetical protein XAP6984_1450032 [Xanthomonas phaseoli pv. phaseoli]SON88033.1 hypothetical protein XAP412_570007 [Xanthomonas phaseoli pv. phaseoli]SON91493.1 hypothetical protein XAP7430_580007 [Xanthomonas phaseoli pv. phaseoli]SOO30373.1 hypothetical protein XAP6164_430007 [Xanthomonas phaseoli pv. phaseoli]